MAPFGAGRQPPPVAGVKLEGRVSQRGCAASTPYRHSVETVTPPAEATRAIHLQPETA